MKKVFNILLIALILTILWILFLIINPNSSEIQGIKSVKTEYDNYYTEIDKKIEKEFDKNSYLKFVLFFICICFLISSNFLSAILS